MDYEKHYNLLIEKENISDEYRQKLKDAKKDYVPWNADSLWVTPFGTFTSLNAAVKNLDFSRSTIYNRCKSDKHSEWRHEKFSESS